MIRSGALASFKRKEKRGVEWAFNSTFTFLERKENLLIRPSAASVLALLCGSLVAQTTPTRPTVLVTSGTEAVSSTNATGAATRVGGVVVGSAGSNTSTYEHSEVWEVVRRFSEGCLAATFVTNPETPHTMTIHTDYEKFSSIVLGKLVLYQLSLLDEAANPLYVTKKNYLRREVKPICKVIEQRIGSAK